MHGWDWAEGSKKLLGIREGPVDAQTWMILREESGLIKGLRVTFKRLMFLITFCRWLLFLLQRGKFITFFSCRFWSWYLVWTSSCVRVFFSMLWLWWSCSHLFGFSTWLSWPLDLDAFSLGWNAVFGSNVINQIIFKRWDCLEGSLFSVAHPLTH